MNTRKLLSRIVTTAITLTLGLCNLTNITSYAATSTPDSTTPRMITIHALQADSSPYTSDGASIPELEDGSYPGLSHVKFEAKKVIPADGFTVATMDVNNEASFVVVGGAIQAETDVDGVAILPISNRNDQDGYFLVQQLTKLPGTTPMTDFFAQVPYNQLGVNGSWQYNVHVYPKLDAQSAIHTNILIGDLITDTRKQHSMKPGHEVTLSYVTSLDPSMVLADGTVNGANLMLSSTMSTHFSIFSSTLSIGMQNENHEVQLINLTFYLGTDYKFTVIDNTWTLQLTPAGLKKAMSSSITIPEGSERVLIPQVTYTLSDTYTYGVFTNNYSVVATNAYGMKLDANTSYSEEFTSLNGSNISAELAPYVYSGGLSIRLHDPSTQTLLPGVTFTLLDEFSKPVLDSKGTVITATSDQEGIVTIHGLTLDQTASDHLARTPYILRYESGLTDGRTMPNTVVVYASLQPKGDAEVGYDDTINITTDPEVNPSLQMPFTGGVGNISNWILGLVAICLGFVILVIKRKKRNDINLRERIVF